MSYLIKGSNDAVNPFERRFWRGWRGVRMSQLLDKCKIVIILIAGKGFCFELWMSITVDSSTLTRGHSTGAV